MAQQNFLCWLICCCLLISFSPGFLVSLVSPQLSPLTTGFVSTLSLSSPLATPGCLVSAPVGEFLFGCESGESNRCFQISAIRSSSPQVFFLTELSSAGFSDGAGDSAQLNGPLGMDILVIRPDIVKLFIADTGNHVIRLITVVYPQALQGNSTIIPLSVTVATLAGSPGSPGNSNGASRTLAKFFGPRGLALARNGLFIADSSNHVIRYLPLLNDSTLVGPSGSISPAQLAQAVSTVSGTSGQSGIVDGFPGQNRYRTPIDISALPSGLSLSQSEYWNSNATLFVLHQHALTMLNSSNFASLVAGGPVNGLADGIGISARFQSPSNVHWDLLGNAYIADSGNNVIRAFQLSTGQVTTIVGGGVGNSDILVDGYPVGQSTLMQPAAVAFAKTPSEVDQFFISDSGHSAIRASTAVCVRPCQNGGTCTELNKCSCVGNWTAVDCSVAICTSGCPTGQFCLAPNVCGCQAGFNGSTCDVPICTASCANGNCSSPYTCSCEFGWTSSTFGGPCTQAICNSPCANGQCVAPDTCQCAANWNGTQCNIPFCAAPCQNGFSCVAPNTCNCSSQYTGIDCSVPVCTAACQNGGNCTAPDTCTCPAGVWMGSACQAPVCPLGCVNGACIAPGQCNCSAGWSGVSCQQAICPLGCFNGGNCTTPGVCTCPTGWGGPLSDCSQPLCSPPCKTIAPFSMASPFEVCQAAIVYPGYGISPPPVCASGCVDVSCDNSGYCKAIDTCECVGFWTGTNCSTPICPGGCDNGGLCTGAANCTCVDGYFPPASAIGSPGCSEIQCSCANGFCTTPNNCTCLAGWQFDAATGNCSTPLCDFPGIPYYGCANNGTCAAPNLCDCPTGFDDGAACRIPQCSPKCLRGTCAAPNFCICEFGFTGSYCQTLIVAEDNIFDANFRLFLVAILVFLAIFSLFAFWYVRKRKDLLKKRKFAYASEFDARKEILREKKRRLKEKVKMAAERGGDGGDGEKSGKSGGRRGSRHQRRKSMMSQQSKRKKAWDDEDGEEIELGKSEGGHGRHRSGISGISGVSEDFDKADDEKQQRDLWPDEERRLINQGQRAEDHQGEEEDADDDEEEEEIVFDARAAGSPRAADKPDFHAVRMNQKASASVDDGEDDEESKMGI